MTRNGIGRILLVLLVGLFVACGEGTYRPRGNAIGETRHQQFTDVVAHAKSLPVGTHHFSDLPDRFHHLNLIAVYTTEKTCAIEFPSAAIDSNPIYVYVEHSVPDPEAVVRELCSRHGSWRFAHPLDEKGWYYVHGP